MLAPPLFISLLFSLIAAGQNPIDPPKKGEQKKLVIASAKLDPLADDFFARRMAIVRRLDLVPLSKGSEIKAWRKAIAKADAKHGAKLEKDSGNQWTWEDSKRGLFILGGKTSKPKGLVIGMHGGGQGSGSAASIHSSMSRAAAEFDLLEISPEVLEKTERGWTDSGTEAWVLYLVDAAIRTWGLNPNRVYFSGHSMGGYGSWTLGAHHADRVAALAPSAGAPTPVYGPDGKIFDIDRGVVPNLRNVPMVCYQSIDDPRVPPDANQAAVKEVGKAKDRWGGYEDFEYWEVDGRAHQAPPGGFAALLEKIVGFERKELPDKIVWQPSLSWKHQFYWLWWEQPIQNSVVVATLDRAGNSIHLESSANLSGLEVLLDDRLIDMSKEFILLVNDQEVLRAKPKPSLGTLVLTSLHPDPHLQFLARVQVPAYDS
jgi:pimeloyl-ACP methyl ester carboxylesterase